MKNKHLSRFLLLMIVFAVIISGGCGGSGGSLETGQDEEQQQPQEQTEEQVSEEAVLDDEKFDSNGDGIPDVLDFSEVEQNSYEKGEIIENKRISVPSIQSLEELKIIDSVKTAGTSQVFTSAEDTEIKTVSPDSFLVDLTAGKEYTVEFSREFSYAIGSNFPNIEIINPQGVALSFLDFGEYDENHDEDKIIDLNPDVIELSIYPPEAPSVICYTFTPASTGTYKINLSRVPIISEDIVKDNENEHIQNILFIYEEQRNEKGEAGYYKRYKFSDADGNTSETINIIDIIELRKVYLECLKSVFVELFAMSDENGNIDDDAFESVVYNNFEPYFNLLLDLRKYYGIFDIKDDVEDEENDIENSSISLSATKTKTQKGNIKSKGTQIPSTLYGIPYADDFEESAGFFAITGVKTINDAIKKFTIPVPKTKKVKALYTAKFISSQEEREKLSKTNANASVAIGGFGVNASYSSNSSFKFGLTSTTLVIHYEELETSYRSLANSQYSLTTDAKNVLKKGSTAFRNEYGDYFVAGYKYGGTYDAFISITTETTEQLEEVKKKLGANYSSVGKSVSADIANETKDVLKKNNATVTIEIRTAGIDTKSDPQTTTNVDAIGDVSSQLQAFRKQLKTSKPSDYQPVYVMLKRYRVLSPVLTQMNKNKDNGLIPISPAQSSKIMNFNRDLLIMQSYYNVIAGLDGSKIDLEARDLYSKKYNNIVDTVKAYGNSFYMESNLKNMQAMQKKITNLSSQLKALGDRYAFYRLLVSAQTQEAAAANTTDVTKKPFGANGGAVGSNSFSISKAVTSDIAAGENKHDGIHQFAGKTWDPKFEAGANRVFCYIKVVANNTYDNARKAEIPCVGTNTAKFYFECGVARWLEWDVYLRSMRFTPALYPFYGLK